jgi:PAS domain S-box-containing protein
MENTKIAILERALLREKEARKQAERILEEKSLELYELNSRLKKILKEDRVNLQCPEEFRIRDFEFLNDAYLMIDLSGNVLKMNEAAFTLLEYNFSDEPVNILKLVGKDDYIYAIRSFRKLIKDGHFSDFNVRLRTKSGKLKLIQVNSNLIYNEKEKPVAAEGILRDITEEHKIRTLLEERQEQLSLIVNNAPFGIVLSGEGVTQNTNRAFQEMLGYSEEEAINLTPVDLFPKEDLEKIGLLLQDMNSGRKKHTEFIQNIKKKDGSLITAKINMTVLLDHIRNVPYRLSLVEDISEKLRVEKQKEQLLLHLEKSNKELEEYAHVVSHDLKSPLRSISALVSWIKEDNQGLLHNETLQNFSLIESTLEKMENLINGILNYSSISINKKDEKWIDLQEVVENILKLIYIPENITVTIVKPLPKVRGESIRFQQLFQNIISNAVKYNDKEKGKIAVDYQEEGEYYVFSIEDNGIGIAREYYEKIFGMFQSLSQSTDSTGIGLSIVKKIVDLYGGEIYLESKEGEGTTFFVKLKK